MAIGVFEYKEEQRRDLFLSDYYQPLRIEVVWITFDRAIIETSEGARIATDRFSAILIGPQLV